MCKSTVTLLESKTETWKHVSSAYSTVKQIKVFLSGIVYEDVEIDESLKSLTGNDQKLTKEMLISQVQYHIQKLKPYATRAHNQVLYKTLNTTESEIAIISESHLIAAKSEVVLEMAKQYKDGMNKAGFTLDDTEVAALKTSLDNYRRISSTRKTVAGYKINSTANIEELINYCKFNLKKLDSLLEDQVKDKEFITIYKKTRNKSGENLLKLY